MKRILPLILIFLLSACNLSANILGGAESFAYTPSYTASGQEHTISITFQVENSVITEVTIEPGAASRRELANQLTFIANVRPYLLGKNVSEVSAPASIGGESLNEAFAQALEDLKMNF